MLTIDHVIWPVLDLHAAAAEMEARHGLASVEGGRHPTWGTANRIIPLGDTYLELVAVVDHETAAGAAFGRWVAGATPGRPLGWAVRTDAIETVAHRLGLAVVPGSRAAPGGSKLTWRSAGVEVATLDAGLPFFIQWGEGVPLPGATDVHHPGGAARLKLLSLGGDPGRLAGWLGDHDLPIAEAAGPSRVSAVLLAQGDRDVELPAGGRSSALHIRR